MFFFVKVHIELLQKICFLPFFNCSVYINDNTIINVVNMTQNGFMISSTYLFLLFIIFNV